MRTSPTQRAGRRDLTTGSLAWNVFSLAVPSAVGILLGSLYNLVDAFWLGKVNQVALAAPGLTGPLFFVVFSLGFGLGIGGAALVAQHTGAGRHGEADRAAAQTIVLLCGVVTSLAVPMAVLAPQVLKLMRAPAEVIGPASGYLRIFMLGLPLAAFTMGYASVLRALGDTITVVVISGAANILNAGLDPLLIFGVGPLPALGVRGAALASVISQGGACYACTACLRRGRAGLRLRWADFKPDRALLWRITRIGVPASVASSFSSIGFAFFQVIINSLGITVVAAFTIGSRVLRLFDAPVHAMASATAPIVGQALGAGDVGLARRAVRFSALLFAAVMIAPLVMLTWKGHAVAGWFINEPDVVAETGKFFMLVPWSTYCFGILMMLMSAFYGSGHTRPAMVISIIRVALVRLPVACLLVFGLKWGSLGAYTGMVAGNVVAALVAFALFARGGWEKGVVPTGSPDPGADA